jgi:uncharacterized membrane protein
MKIFTDHRWTISAGVILALVIATIGIITNSHYAGFDIDTLVRFAHILTGITWIGLLYYFNFVQVPSLGGVTAETKADIFKEGSIVRRALWWFRWGAMFTLIFGLVLYGNLTGSD